MQGKSRKARVAVAAVAAAVAVCALVFGLASPAGAGTPGSVLGRLFPALALPVAGRGADAGERAGAEAGRAAFAADGETVDGTTLAAAALVAAPKAMASTRAQVPGATATSGGAGPGASIDSVTVEWVTADTPSDDGDAPCLLVTPTDDSPQRMQARISFSLSGSHDYEPGEIAITVPRNILSGRYGGFVGAWSLSVPEAPDGHAAFSYAETPDSFVITNERRLSAATQGMVEMSLGNVIPHEVNGNPDRYQTSPFSATVTVTTPAGTVSRTSDSITAAFRTSASVGSSATRGLGWYASYPSSWPSAMRPEDAGQYVYCDFYSYADVHGNQTYGIGVSHRVASPDLGDGIVLGVMANGRITVGSGTAALSRTVGTDAHEFSTDARPHLYPTHVYAAFRRPTSASAVGTGYTVRDTATYSLTDADNGSVSTATSTGQVNVTYVAFSVPGGELHVGKSGGHTYAASLNRLASGADATAGFTVDTSASQTPWTWEDANGDGQMQADEIGRRAVTTTVTDDVVTLDGHVLGGDDYDFSTLSFGRPATYDYAQATGSTFDPVSLATRSTGTWGFVYDGAYQPPTEHVWGYVDGAWQLVGDISWQGQTAVLSNAMDGASLAGPTLTLPAGVKQWRLAFDTPAPYVSAWVDCTVRVHPTDATRALAATKLASEGSPTSSLVNHVGGVWQEGEATLGRMAWSAIDTFDGLFQGATLGKTVSYDNDTSGRQVRLRYASTVTEQSNAQTEADWEAGLAAGAVTREGGGTFYDLLPRGVVADPVSVAVSGGAVRSVRTVDDYKGSGRTLMVVEAAFARHATYQGYGILGTGGLTDAHTLTFDAVYSWESLTDFGQRLDNVIAFESDNPWVGSVSGLSGEPDDSTAGRNAGSAAAVAGVEGVMTDLDPDRDDPSFLYASAEAQVTVDTSAVSSFTKRVAVNGSGTYSDGQGTDELDAYEGGSYTYRLRAENPTGQASRDMVIYDALDGYVPAAGDDAGDATWRGTLADVDLSQMRAVGADPVVWYSTEAGLRVDDASDRSDLDLGDGSTWSTTEPADKASVTAIAIDLRHAADGSDFTLGPGKSVVAYVRMRAPKAADVDATDPASVWDTTLAAGASEAGAGGAHAYNAATLVSTSVSADTGAASERQLAHDDYTKVGLKPFRVRVTKAFDDADDQDGLRPASVTLHVTADGTDTGRSVTLSSDDGWEAELDDLPASDAAGRPVTYGVTEDAVKGYAASVRLSHDATSQTIAVTDTHVPETTTLSGTKSWDDEGHSDKRPDTVSLTLHRSDGQTVGTVATNAASGWRWSLHGLPRYHDHGIPYDYWATEDGYCEGYVPQQTSATDFTNHYCPYGALAVSKDVTGATDEAKGEANGFAVTILRPDGEPEPGTFSTVVTGPSGSQRTYGTFANGQTVSLTGGQTLTISAVPSGDTYHVEETQPAPGYTQTARTGDVGTIRAGQTSEASFTNAYDATGSVVIQARKELTGRALEAHQFRFELRDGSGDVVRTATNDADGNVVFGRIDYGLADLGRTYAYTIAEVDSGRDGYAYDAHTATVSVSVEDFGYGRLGVRQTLSGDATFRNAYKASGSVSLSAWKALSGGGIRDLEAGEFRFELRDGSGDVVSTGTNAADGTIAFSPIAYTEADAGKTYTYTAREVAGTDADVTYTDKTYTFTVRVTDDGDGTLSFDTSSDARPVFENALKPGSLALTKRVAGDNPTPHRRFRFHVRLIAPPGERLPEGTTGFTRTSADGAASE